MLISGNYIRAYLALSSDERKRLRALFKTYDATKRNFPTYNARKRKYLALEFAYEQHYVKVLNALHYDMEYGIMEEE